MRALLPSTIIAFVALSELADRGSATLWVISGTVTEFQVGEVIRVACEQTDPKGIEIALRKTVYDGDPADITPGVGVTVWFRSVGERRPVADKVRVLLDVTSQP
jgi:hypothetical protein